MQDVISDIKHGWSELKKSPMWDSTIMVGSVIISILISLAVVKWLMEPWGQYWPQLVVYVAISIFILCLSEYKLTVIVSFIKDVVGKGNQPTQKAAPKSQPLQAEQVDERLIYIQDWLKANPHVGLPVMMSAAEVAQLAARPTKAQYDEVLQALDASLQARNELASKLDAVIKSLSTEAVEAALSNAEELLKRLDLPLNANVRGHEGTDIV